MNMFKLWKQLMAERRGASAIEYGLVAALIAVVIATTTTNIGQRLLGVFTSIQNQLPAGGS